MYPIGKLYYLFYMDIYKFEKNKIHTVHKQFDFKFSRETITAIDTTHYRKKLE